MNDNDRRFLTKWSEECWHENTPKALHTCRKCKGVMSTNRLFTSPNDAAWVKDKLKENSLWDEFRENLLPRIGLDTNILMIENMMMDALNTISDPPIFCEKVVKFLKKKEA